MGTWTLRVRLLGILGFHFFAQGSIEFRVSGPGSQAQDFSDYWGLACFKKVYKVHFFRVLEVYGCNPNNRESRGKSNDE